MSGPSRPAYSRETFIIRITYSMYTFLYGVTINAGLYISVLYMTTTARRGLLYRLGLRLGPVLVYSRQWVNGSNASQFWMDHNT